MSRVSEEFGRRHPPVLDLNEFDSDLASLDDLWCSKEVKEKIAFRIKSLIKGNTSCFSRIDINPLYRTSTYGYYRVVIYIRDYFREGFLSSNRIWRDYYIKVEGPDCRICSATPHLTDKI